MRRGSDDDYTLYMSRASRREMLFLSTLRKYFSSCHAGSRLSAPAWHQGLRLPAGKRIDVPAEGLRAKGLLAHD